MLCYFSSNEDVVYVHVYYWCWVMLSYHVVLDLLMCAMSVQGKLTMDLNRGPSIGTYVKFRTFQGLVYIKKHGPHCISILFINVGCMCVFKLVIVMWISHVICFNSLCQIWQLLQFNVDMASKENHG